MGCCGQGRAALRAAAQAPDGPGVSTVDSPGPLRLEAVTSTTLYALGAVTRKRYVLRPGERLDRVDSRDLPALLASGLFRTLD